MTAEALMQSLTDRVRASLGDAMAEKLRVTRLELAESCRAMKDLEQQLSDERSLRIAAEVARDNAQSDLTAALNRTDDSIPLMLNSALTRIDGVASKVVDIGKAISDNTKALNAIQPGPSEIAFDVRRDAADKIIGVVAKGKT